MSDLEIYEASRMAPPLKPSRRSFKLGHPCLSPRQLGDDVLHTCNPRNIHSGKSHEPHSPTPNGQCHPARLSFCDRSLADRFLHHGQATPVSSALSRGASSFVPPTSRPRPSTRHHRDSLMPFRTTMRPSTYNIQPPRLKSSDNSTPYPRRTIQTTTATIPKPQHASSQYAKPTTSSPSPTNAHNTMQN
jgi:hypothetical protein